MFEILKWNLKCDLICSIHCRLLSLIEKYIWLFFFIFFYTRMVDSKDEKYWSRKMFLALRHAHSRVHTSRLEIRREFYAYNILTVSINITVFLRADTYSITYVENINVFILICIYIYICRIYSDFLFLFLLFIIFTLEICICTPPLCFFHIFRGILECKILYALYTSTSGMGLYRIFAIQRHDT